MAKKREEGFTLIELSIVLVIIGLIVGGILEGRDLINAARVRAQISQITQYNTATNTFHEKYGGLPGDLLSGSNYFSGINFQNPNPGMGNGDGIIQDISDMGNEFGGEVLVFWYELNAAGLIPDATNAGSGGTWPGNYNGMPGVINSSNVPNGKIAGTNVSVYWNYINNGNYWILAYLYNNYGPIWSPGLAVIQASQIDGKIDDGNPGTGNVVSIASGGQGLGSLETPGVPGDAGTAPGGTTGCTTSSSFSVYNVANAANKLNCAISIAVSF